MVNQRRLGLTAKFNFLTIALILATSFGIGAFVTFRGKVNNYENLLRKGMTTAAILAQNSEYGIYAEDRTSLRQIVESLDADADVAFVAVTGACAVLTRSGDPTALRKLHLEQAATPVASTITWRRRAR